MQVRRANIPAELRRQFESFGADVLTHAVGGGVLSSKGPPLDKLLQEKQPEILAWLQEQADARKLREQQTHRHALIWTIVAAVAGIIAALTGIIAVWPTVWPILRGYLF
jgi:hypothetical protein